ncbi:hypothetical protein [Pedobacter sp. Leaf176]|uniref:hypothetical protein n=1 Tax=Pedobacter sp. Leaf176 TaxID=1736286 RepID=UPI0006FF945F|nr:hypothetical protein [Pedobacter sp. Leaf176]KQR71878.1 hypothetical protein ASF92_00775 [Pedobacter sp. Leaf176]
MANQINPNLIKDKVLAKQVIESQNELEKIKIERGWLGDIWGNSEKIPNNLAALLIVILILTGLIYTCIVSGMPSEKISLQIKDLWSIISPLITLSIGYLFGDKSKKGIK